MATRADFESPMFGIANEHGSLWSHQTFYTEADAGDYLRTHFLNQSCDLSRHTVVPVSVFIKIKK